MVWALEGRLHILDPQSRLIQVTKKTRNYTTSKAKLAILEMSQN